MRHEAGIKRGWAAWIVSPRVAALRRRLAPQIEFLQARLSPQGYLGLRLTIGATMLVGASWLFGGIAEDVMTGDPLTVVDTQVANWFHVHATPAVTRLMLLVTLLHGTVATTVLACALAAFLICKREWYRLLALALGLPGGMLLNVLTKYAFQRARPGLHYPLLEATGYSFPSGHMAAATLFYGVLVYVVVPHVRQWRWQVFVVLASFPMVALVGLSRIYLGLHYLSDVLAGFAESIAWLAPCITAIHTLLRQRAATG